MTETKTERVTRLLRADLGSPGSQLPSEAEVGQRYDVGRGTVRNAFAALESEGLITSSRGEPRKVRGRKRWTWRMDTWERAHSGAADAWNNTIAEQGGVTWTEVTVTVVKTPHNVATALNIEPGQPTYVRSRVRWIDDEPHQLADSYFPKWLTDNADLLTQPGDISAPGGLLTAAGYPQERLHDEVGARMPTPDESDALWIPRGTPLMTYVRVGYDKHERPLRYMVARMPADRVLLTYDLEV